jgi:hypothetical protein
VSEWDRSKRHISLINFLARVVGFVFCITGVSFLVGSLIVQDSLLVDLTAGVLSLVVGVLLIRVRKATLEDVEKYFGRRR